MDYLRTDDIDDNYVVRPRDYSWRGAPSPNAGGQKRAGRGREFGFDHEPDYSDTLYNSDFYYRSRQSTPDRGASYGRGSSRGEGHQRGRGTWGIAGPDVDLFGPKDFLRKRHLDSKLRGGNTSLSQLLYEDRPFRKPITFVRSKTTPTLFLRDEEIFKPVAEEAGEQEASHAPTADRVYRIFHGGNPDPQPPGPLSDEEELLEIDYADLGKFMSEIEVATASKKTKTTTPAAVTAAIATATTLQKDDSLLAVTPAVEEPPGFYIDTKPSPVQDSSTPTNVIAVEHHSTAILGEVIDEDEEIIVYVAPHPRNSKLASAQTQTSPDAKTPPPAAVIDPVAIPIHQKPYEAPHTPPPPPKLDPVLWPETFPKDVVVPAPSPAPAPAPAFKDFSFSHISKSPKATHRVRRIRHSTLRKAERNAKFSLRGAMREEATLRELDPRRAEQRRGDSDVDWGGSTSGNEEGRGMLVDQDIGVDVMAAFVRSMGVAGQAQVSTGDLDDEARIRLEDADEENESASGSDEDPDTELELADGLQGILATESEGELASRGSLAEDEEDDTSEDDEETPKRSFQTRLERIRARTAGQPVQDIVREGLDQDWGLDGDLNSDSDIDSEDDIISQMESFLDENDEILRGTSRRQRNFVFRAINNGTFEFKLGEYIDATPKRKKDKQKYIPTELHDQWQRDREKKAERKRIRELERIAAANAELFTPRKKKKGKKARKARQAAAAAASISLETVTGHIRDFVADLDGAPTLSLPAMTREMRKSVHELAHAFNLTSKSSGKGETRFTTLAKTTLSGVQVDERRVAQILRQPKPPPAYGSGDRKGKGKGKVKVKVENKIRARDGDVVGGAAPKIDGSNVGFQMLAAMGWEEGSRIGTVGGVGLDAPLLAVIKTTKLGLGASSRRG